MIANFEQSRWFVDADGGLVRDTIRWGPSEGEAVHQRLTPEQARAKAAVLVQQADWLEAQPAQAERG